MSFSRKSDGSKRGAANGRILRRSYHIAEAAMDAGGPSIPIETMNMLQRLQYASNYFFALAESERKKGHRANVMFIFELMNAAATCAAKAAPYLHPKLAAMPFEVSLPRPERPRREVDLEKLTDDELAALEELMRKAAVTTPDKAQDPSDEYPRTTRSRAAGSYSTTDHPNLRG
jgi:hypothetical protein